MKNKKIMYAIIGIVILISMVVIIAIISNKPMPIDHTPKEATSILEELKKKSIVFKINWWRNIKRRYML